MFLKKHPTRIHTYAHTPLHFYVCEDFYRQNAAQAPLP